MVDAIGESAGKVWRYLGAQGPRSVSQIQRGTGLSQSQTYLALGGLAREGRLRFEQEGRALLVGVQS